MRQYIKTILVFSLIASLATVFGATGAIAWATKGDDKSLTGEELKALIVGKTLNYVFSKQMKQKGSVSYGKDGHYAVKFDNAGTLIEWGGPYRITEDGQVCTLRDPNTNKADESCELFVLAKGKTLTKIDGMDGRYAAKISK